MSEIQLQKIYLGKVEECLDRLRACEVFLEFHKESGNVYFLESAILQMRKSLECVAYAAIAPNKKEYKEYRAKADRQSDYTRDYHAGKILEMLSKINKDFYPKPVSSPISKGPGRWHFDKREDGALTKKQFSSFYDRLGKFLHADNPWGNDKGINNILQDIPVIINSVKSLLSWHFTKVSTPIFTGVWVVEVPFNGEKPKIVIGKADGEFLVK
ncbi:MAG: hypothetical protein IPK65_00040 [Gammaproteobacteria bacterium]|nr:hypothetical protein [Gammaproteobacteria bacterium]